MGLGGEWAECGGVDRCNGEEGWYGMDDGTINQYSCLHRAKSIPNTDVLPKVAVHKRHDDFRPVQVCPSFTSSKKVVQCAKDGAMLMFVSVICHYWPFHFVFACNHQNNIFCLFDPQ